MRIGKAIVWGFLAWAVLVWARGGSSLGVVTASCWIAGAVSGRALAGVAVGLVLAALQGTLASSGLSEAVAALRSGASPSDVSTWGAVLRPLLPAASGLIAGWLAGRAGDDREREAFEAVPVQDADVEHVPWIERWIGGAHPDWAVAWLVRRRQWASAARVAERLGMPRSAQRWWKEAGQPDEARRAAAQLAAGSGGAPRAVELDTQAAASRAAPPPDPAPPLELEYSRAARFVIEDDDEDEKP